MTTTMFTTSPSHVTLVTTAGTTIVSATVRGGLVVLLAGAAVRLWPRASAAQRHLVWTAACCSLLLLPILGVIVPRWNWRVLPADAPVTTAIMRLSRAIMAEEVFQTPRNVLQAIVKAAASQHHGAGHGKYVRSSHVGVGDQTDAWGWMAVVTAAWACGALAVFVTLLYSHRRVRSFVATAVPVADAHVLEVFNDAVRLTRPVRPIPLREHPRGVPMVYGVLRPGIILPTAARKWDDGRLRRVLLHELAHVERCDNLTQTIASFACALHWFNPLVWVVARELRLERERACDDLVVTRGTHPVEYAEDLLALAQLFSPTQETALAALAFARQSQIHRRLLAIVDGRQRRALVSRGVAVAVWGGALGVVAPLTAVTLHPIPVSRVTMPAPVCPTAVATPFPTSAGTSNLIARTTEGSSVNASTCAALLASAGLAVAPLSTQGEGTHAGRVVSSHSVQATGLGDRQRAGNLTSADRVVHHDTTPADSMYFEGRGVIGQSGDDSATVLSRVGNDQTTPFQTTPVKTDPIVIVDGIRVTVGASQRLQEIKPNDIATIEVFKGPAAATMYGADAAGGMIVITTKSKSR